MYYIFQRKNHHSYQNVMHVGHPLSKVLGTRSLSTTGHDGQGVQHSWIPDSLRATTVHFVHCRDFHCLGKCSRTRTFRGLSLRLPQLCSREGRTRPKTMTDTQLKQFSLAWVLKALEHFLLVKQLHTFSSFINTY